MYGKIFDSIYDGTLSEDWRALVTFQQFIVLCDADGMVDMTPQAISRRTGIPIEHIKAGIEVLEKADKYSRTPDENGKRIELIDEHRPWGWHIVNHEKYKNMRDSDTVRAQTRERVRRHREKKRAVTHGNAEKRHINTNIKTNTTNIDKSKKFKPPTVDEVTEYCNERKNSVNPNKFIDHYESNGWMRGKTKIKDWKACVRTWENNDRGQNNGQNKFDNRSRAQRVSDRLDQLAEEAIARGETP